MLPSFGVPFFFKGKSTLDVGLVAYWPLNGNSNDVTGNGHNGTDTSAVYAAAKISQGLTTNGTGYSTYPAITLGANHAFSLSAWVYRTGGSSLLAIVGEQNTIGLFTNDAGGNRFMFTYGASQYHSDVSAWALNTWSHVVLTYDGVGGSLGKFRWYVNGGAAFIVNSATSGVTWAPSRLGTAFFNTLTHRGAIDEIGLWNRQLTDAEAAQLYAGGAGKAYPF